MKPLVIFDCDGVLVDSEPLASAVLSRHLSRVGIDLTPEQCRLRFTGLSLDSCGRVVEQEAGRCLPAGFFAHLQADTYAAFVQELQPVSGVIEVLDWLHRDGWPFCVASSGSHEKMAVSLSATGLQSFFANRIYSAVDVVHGKPAPDLFLHAARGEGFAPENCIVIEDSWPGCQAGIASGMRVLAYRAPESFEALPGVRRFTGMSELPAMLMSWQAERNTG